MDDIITLPMHPANLQHQGYAHALSVSWRKWGWDMEHSQLHCYISRVSMSVSCKESGHCRFVGTSSLPGQLLHLYPDSGED